jgi:rhodanese-related sulfurtransferase
MPLGDVDAYGWNALKSAGIPADTRELLVVCRSGMRSQRAIARLRSERSDATLINLDGGMIAWCNEGLPTRPG